MIYYQYSAIEKFRTTIKFDLYFRRVTFPPPILCCWAFRALSTRWMWNLKAISWGRSTSQVQGEQVKLRFTWPRGKQRRITNGRKIKPEICTIFNRFSYFFTAMKWLPLLLEPLQSKWRYNTITSGFFLKYKTSLASLWAENQGISVTKPLLRVNSGAMCRRIYMERQHQFDCLTK